MVYTSENGLKALRAKDQRISFLSIFSTLGAKFTGVDVEKAVELAFQINEKLYEAYPFVETERERLEKTTSNNVGTDRDVRCGEWDSLCGGILLLLRLFFPAIS